jgi:uncharacterized protein YecE (DUF72 family)
MNPVIANILTGSASWTDKSLIACGRFYPPDARTAESRLRFYATQFPLVEVDSSFYGMPTAQNARLWVERTPAEFTFNVKAFRLFTGHAAQPQVLHRDIQQALGPGAPRSLRLHDLPRELQDELWRRFIEAIAPLRAAGKLGAVLFQFSPSVRRSPVGRAVVEEAVSRMPSHLLSVEFRHRTWFEDAHADETLAWQRELGVVHTVVDSPRGFANTVPCIWEATHPALALVRLHGRNAQTWNITHAASSASRFNYWYSADELAAMVPELQHLAGQVRKVHVVFNTNAEDQGQVHARMMRGLLYKRDKGRGG